MMCSPSSTHRPLLRRSREDAIRRAASLRRGLSREVMRGKTETNQRSCRASRSRWLIRWISGGPRIARKLEEHFVLPHHAELRARAFFDRFHTLLEIAYIGVERGVAGLETGIDLSLRLDLGIELAHPQPPALA